MIRDLSETLRAVLSDPTLKDAYPELSHAQVVFDRPVESFNPAQTSIDLFLYDVRENMELRSLEPVVTTLADRKVTIARPAVRLTCSYLLTAWPVGGTEVALQEHRLLSQVFEVLARYPTIPVDYLKGRLKGQEPPLPLLTARTEGMKEPYEFWTAIGSKMRASIVVAATIAVAPSAAPIEAEKPLRSRVDIDFDMERVPAPRPHPRKE